MKGPDFPHGEDKYVLSHILKSFWTFGSVFKHLDAVFTSKTHLRLPHAEDGCLRMLQMAAGVGRINEIDVLDTFQA